MKTASKTSLVFLVAFICQIQGMSLPTPTPAEEASLVDPDPLFSLNIANLEDIEISRTLQTISGAVMGTAEIALGIKSDLKLLRKEIMMGKMNMRFEGRHHPDSDKVDSDKVTPVQIQPPVSEMSQFLESFNNVLANVTNSGVDSELESTRKIITTNFIRILSAMLINGPPSTQRRKDDILKLMRTVLNGEINYSAVVTKLPFILKESETNQFISLIQSIKEDEFPKINKARQEDEDEDGEDEVVTVAPVPVPAPTPEFQETVIFLPRPGDQGQAGVVTAGGVIAGGVGRPVVVGTNNKTGTGQTLNKTQAPLRIVVRQPQPKPAPTLASTMKPKTQFQKITDAVVGQINVNQFQGLIDSLPDLFAGIDGLVDGVEGIIGDQPST